MTRSRAGVLLLFAGVAVVEVYLARMPLPVDVEAVGAFSPAVALADREQLVFEGPVTPDPEDPLLLHRALPDEELTVHFESARLADEDRRRLAVFGLEPPEEAAEVSYGAPYAAASGAGERCRTGFEVRFRDPGADPALILFSRTVPSVVPQASLGLAARDARLAVRLETTPPPGTEAGPGCGKKLTIGSWEATIAFPVTVVAEPDRPLRVLFDEMGGAPIPAAGLLHAGFTRARGARIERRDAPVEAGVTAARSAPADPPLEVASLGLTLERLEARLGGRGQVVVDGRRQTVDLLARLKRHPLAGTLLGTLNTFLVTALLGLFRKTPKSAKPAPEPAPTARRRRRRRAHGPPRAARIAARRPPASHATR